ncbi:MAG: phytoene desaturase family protein [Propylenella sp.]
MTESDAIIIGGGHNGLVCAAYLAKAGLKVIVLERRHVVGGAAVTEEFFPGFKNSVAAYTVSLLNPKIIRDLELHRHGLRIVERSLQNFLPLPDGRFLKVGPGRTRAEAAKFSARDAGRIDEYEAMLERVAGVLRSVVLETPPNVTEGLAAALPEFWKAVKLARRAGRLDMEERRELADLFLKSAGDMLDSWFEGDALKALFGFDSIVGSYQSPYTPGSAYVLLHHAFGETNGRRGVWGHAIGGMGAITQAMARCCAERGVVIRTDASVREVILEKGRTTGVVTKSGDVFRAKIVASNLNPKLLFGRLIDSGALPSEFLRRMAIWRSGSGSFRMNLALSELPDFSCLPGKQPAEHHTAGVIIGPSLAYMDRAFLDARLHGWSRAPVIEMLIPSTLDDSLAPAGRHVASLFCQHVAPELPADFPGGSSWDDHRDKVADLMIATVNAHAPNFAASMIGRQVLSPLDLERDFGLLGGDIFHGQLTLDQLFSLRPMLGYADYRTPIPGLYICGSGAHPGGGVTGAPGHNAAREILRDVRRRRLRRT